MTAIREATVEVLTAEVRVLMVGSRQVTLSVYRQLDETEPGEISPFGRVAPREAEPGYTYVVGASAGGTLVRSRRVSSPVLARRARDTDDRARWAAERERLRRAVAEIPRPDGAYAHAGDSARAGQIHDRLVYLCRLLRDDDRTPAEFAEDAETLTACAAAAAPWDALPLIVLAGLR